MWPTPFFFAGSTRKAISGSATALDRSIHRIELQFISFLFVADAEGRKG